MMMMIMMMMMMMMIIIIIYYCSSNPIQDYKLSNHFKTTILTHQQAI